jgi:hypothetical protein
VKANKAYWFGWMTACTFSTITAAASERYFTYSYEPEAMPKGVTEFEQEVTWRGFRDDAVGQDRYNKWELRSELEYGATDNYTVSLYLNASSENYRDPATGGSVSSTDFNGVSLEQRYMVLNPAEHAIGLALYWETTYSGGEAEIEERIILGQRCGDWKWAVNFTHATEWKDSLSETEGEFEVTFGLTRHLSPHWSLGLEARDHNELPDSYHFWENTAVFLGPVVTCTQEKWWTTLTVLPQIYGNNFQGNPDANHKMELEGHERVNVRLLVGIPF